MIHTMRLIDFHSSDTSSLLEIKCNKLICCDKLIGEFVKHVVQINCMPVRIKHSVKTGNLYLNLLPTGGLHPRIF
jgi:hypothetical protein